MLTPQLSRPMTCILWGRDVTIVGCYLLPVFISVGAHFWWPASPVNTQCRERERTHIHMLTPQLSWPMTCILWGRDVTIVGCYLLPVFISVGARFWWPASPVNTLCRERVFKMASLSLSNPANLWAGNKEGIKCIHQVNQVIVYSSSRTITSGSLTTFRTTK